MQRNAGLTGIPFLALLIVATKSLYAETCLLHNRFITFSFVLFAVLCENCDQWIMKATAKTQRAVRS